MKMFSVLIPLLLVNVLADDLTDYKEQVHTTNIFIQKAYEHNDAKGNGLEIVIKTIVCQDVTMGQFNLMFTLPEDFVLEEILKVKELQTKLVGEIQKILPKPEADQSVPVPDQFNPEPDKSMPEPEPEKFSENSNLNALGEARRVFTGKAVENIIISGFKTRLCGQQRGFISIYICRLIALFRNTKLLTTNSSGYIKTAEIVNSDLCELTSTRGNSITYYRLINDQIFHVWLNSKKKEHLLSSNYSSDQEPKADDMKQASKCRCSIQ